MRWEERRHESVEVARNLRQRSTRAEEVLWDAIRAKRLGRLKFRRQHPVGALVLDFCCPEHMLALEVDGPVHDEQVEWDKARTRDLEELGYRVLRFRNEEVLSSLDGVQQRILTTVEERGT